ncbi:hypothetical protein D6C99_07848 [Aureobasidium pullulans]|nr:hypothetical protein D6C99_07848 [Aureobasidium pullulans]
MVAEQQHHHRRPFDMRDLMSVHTLSSYQKPETQEQEEEEVEEDDDEDREYPNLNALSAVLGNYPLFRANLLQHRRQLIPQTLRCSSDTEEGGLGYTFQEKDEYWSNTQGPNGVRIPRMTSGRVGACARDMVGECRRCGVVVCRNCTMKAPSTNALKQRHRRLCHTCQKAPLDAHTKIYPSQDRDAESLSSPSRPLYRSPCTCATQTWLCTPCSTTLRTSDTSHTRAWTWRSRYNLDTLSGLSTGIGHGLEGVQCGRGPSCLSSRTVYTEIESDAASTPFSARTSAGYFLQEIEGIGGVVKKKVKRRMQVGDVVGEFGDERDGGRVLGREQDGRSRSWCSWCERVVLSRRDVDKLGKIDDRDELGRSLGTESDLSSSSSL